MSGDVPQERVDAAPAAVRLLLPPRRWHRSEHLALEAGSDVGVLLAQPVTEVGPGGHGAPSGGTYSYDSPRMTMR